MKLNLFLMPKILMLEICKILYASKIFKKSENLRFVIYSSEMLRDKAVYVTLTLKMLKNRLIFVALILYRYCYPSTTKPISTAKAFIEYMYSAIIL